MASFDFVVSAESTPYMAWQAMLFHYSCMKHTGQSPIIVVHGDEAELVAGFDRIARKGGRIQRARNFRGDDGCEYAPRNTPGSLVCVASDADYVVLCDPDMIFLGPLPLDRLCLDGDEVSFEHSAYMVKAHSQPALSRASRRAGVGIDELNVPGGVPHVVPARLCESLGHEWLECLKCFDATVAEKGGKPKLWWIAVMWALVFAVRRLRLRPLITNFGTTNYSPARRSEPDEPTEIFLLHYCYGDAEFNKRGFRTHSDMERNVWRSMVTPGSVHEDICKQLAEAGAFYGLI